MFTDIVTIRKNQESNTIEIFIDGNFFASSEKDPREWFNWNLANSSECDNENFKNMRLCSNVYMALNIAGCIL